MSAVVVLLNETMKSSFHHKLSAYILFVITYIEQETHRRKRKDKSISAKEFSCLSKFSTVYMVHKMLCQSTKNSPDDLNSSI